MFKHFVVRRFGMVHPSPPGGFVSDGETQASSPFSGSPITRSLNFSPLLSSFSNHRCYFGHRILDPVLSVWVFLQAFTGAFKEIGHQSKIFIPHFSMVGIYSRNCPEWVIAEQVCLANIERAFMTADISMFFRAGSILYIVLLHRV